MSKPYRKHRWEYVAGYLIKGWPGYERCKDCCVTRTTKTEDMWCGNPRNDAFESFPYPQTYTSDDTASNPWDFERR